MAGIDDFDFGDIDPEELLKELAELEAQLQETAPPEPLSDNWIDEFLEDGDSEEPLSDEATNLLVGQVLFSATEKDENTESHLGIIGEALEENAETKGLRFFAQQIESTAKEKNCAFAATLFLESQKDLPLSDLKPLRVYAEQHKSAHLLCVVAKIVEISEQKRLNQKHGSDVKALFEEFNESMDKLKPLYEKATEFDPELGDAWFGKGFCLFSASIENASSAKTCFEKSFERDGDFSSLHFIGLCYLRLGNKMKASEYFHKLVDFVHTDPEVLEIITADFDLLSKS